MSTEYPGTRGVRAEYHRLLVHAHAQDISFQNLSVYPGEEEALCPPLTYTAATRALFSCEQQWMRILFRVFCF